MTYPETLTAAWQQHLAPRATDAPTVISLFGGCGGSSLGYSMAGFRELLAVEWDDHAAATFKLNFPEVPVYHGDVAKLTVEQILQECSLHPGQLDVLDGSPPCQGFSTAGKRMMDDPRNQLFREYVRILRGLKPKAFVMENVSGMVKGKMSLIFRDVLTELKSGGYRVSARLVNAAYLGVPQARQRMILIGVREDLGITPSHPAPIRGVVTVRRALTALTDDKSPAPTTTVSVSAAMRDCKPGMSLAASTGQPTRFSWVKAHWDEPVMTVLKTANFGGFSVWHPADDRGLTGRELARLQSFPDEFQFVGTSFKDWVARVGNSVPPLAMRAIARHVRTHLLEPIAVPEAA